MEFYNNLMCGRRLRGKFCWKDEEFLGRSIVRWLAARQSPFDISLLRGPLLILLYFHQIDRPNDLLLCRDLLALSYCSLSIFHVAFFLIFLRTLFLWLEHSPGPQISSPIIVLLLLQLQRHSMLQQQGTMCPVVNFSRSIRTKHQRLKTC